MEQRTSQTGRPSQVGGKFAPKKPDVVSIVNQQRKSRAADVNSLNQEPSSTEFSSSSPSRPKSKRQGQNKSVFRGFGSNVDTDEFLKKSAKKKSFFGAGDGEDDDSGLTGEEKLTKMTQKGGMEGLKKFTMTASAADARKQGIGVDVLQRVIVEDEWQVTACLALPSTLIFFILFMLFFQQHYATSYIYLQTGNIRESITDSSYQVNDVQGLYKWMRESLVPYLYTTNMDLSKTMTKDSAGAGSRNEMIGGFLIRTQKTKTEPCKDDIVKKQYLCNHMGILPDVVNKTPHAYMKQDGNWENMWLGARHQDPRPAGGRRLTEWHQRGYEPDTFVEKMVGQLSQWFPRQNNWIKAGTHPWGEKTDEALDSLDAGIATFERVPKKSEDDLLEKAAAEETSASQKKKKRPLNYWQKKSKGWKPLGPMRRMVDPMNTWDSEKPERDARRAKRDEEKARRLEMVRPEFSMGGWIPMPFVADPGVFEIVVPMSMKQEDVIKMINEWEAADLIDRATLFFGVEVILRNPNIGEGILTHTFIQFIFSRGGILYSDVKLPALVLKDSKLVFLWAALWMMMLVFNTVVVPGQTCAAWRRGKLIAHMSRFWNLLEWALMLAGWIIVGVFMIERFGIFKFTKHYKDYKDERNAIPEKCLGIRDRVNHGCANTLMELDTEWFVKIHRNIYFSGNVDSFVQTFVAWYHLFLILRYFVASRGQPRLAIVVNTMKEAAVDLAHLFVVFGIIFIAYVVSGHILFGRRLARLSTIEGSLAYTVQIVLMKEFNFQELSYQDFWTVVIWVYTFVLLVVLVLVNIVLAMIFDTYGEVRGQVTEGDSLFFTFKRIFTQMKFAREWVSNGELLAGTTTMAEAGPSVTAKGFKKTIPHISNYQLQYIFNKARAKVDALLVKGNKNALPEAIASVLIGIAQLKDGVAVMRTGVPPKRYKSAAAAGLGGEEAQKPEEETGWPEEQEDGAFIADADGQPIWLKEGLVPFLKKQQKFLDQVHNEMDTVATQLHMRGIGAGVQRCTVPKPTNPWEDGKVIYPWGHEKTEKQIVADDEVARLNVLAFKAPKSDVPADIKSGRGFE